jgi:hypothetical protein
MNDVIDVINQFAWVGANIVLAYTAVALLVFVVLYYALFDPKATTGGKLIFRFMVSLIGIVGLVYVGIFVDPAHDRGWFVLPDDVADWRPTVRLLIYGYVAFTATSLAILLIKRKWFPQKLKTAPVQELVKVRHETSEIPIVTNHPGDADEN